MNVICDNYYFLIGVNNVIEFVLLRKKFKNIKDIIIISSHKMPEVFYFLCFNNIKLKCLDAILYVHHELFDFLRDIVACPIYNIDDLIKSNPHNICRVRNGHSKLSLSRRQKEVLLMFLQGLNGEDIADNLGVSVKTVSSHKKELMKRLYVCNDIELFYKGVLLSIK
ncbi:helix-turn-helix transcriptional regulator [Escherichia coli]|nr:helix-turn-helix transcriptional regulator [Escherichia coli]